MKAILSLATFFLISISVFAQYPTFRIDYKFLVDGALLQTSEEKMGENKNAFIATATLALAFQDVDKPIAQILFNRKYVRAKTSIYGDNYEINNKEAKETFMVYPESKEYYKTEGFSDKLLDFGDSTKLVSELPIKFVDGEEKTIAGYTCKLAKIISVENDEQIVTIDVWYSEYLPSAYWGEYAYLKNIPGAALEISTSGIGIQAINIEPESDINIFSIPDDYTGIASPHDLSFFFGDSDQYNSQKTDEYYLSDNLIAFLDQELDLYGIKTELGDTLLNPIYSEIQYFENGVAVVSDQDYKFGVIDQNGKVIIPLHYDGLSHNNVDDTFIFYKDGKGGILGLDNKVIIPNSYDYISFFNTHKAIVIKEGKYGIINSKNEVVVPFEFENISEIVVDYFISYIDDNVCVLYDLQGQEIAKYEYIANANRNDMFLVMQNSKYGYIDTLGKVIIPIIYDYASPFYDGLASVIAAGQDELVYINTKGEIIEQ